MAIYQITYRSNMGNSIYSKFQLQIFQQRQCKCSKFLSVSHSLNFWRMHSSLFHISEMDRWISLQQGISHTLELEWNGQMEFLQVAASHSLERSFPWSPPVEDSLLWNGQMDDTPAREFQYSITRLEWTDVDPATGSFPDFNMRKPSMLLKWYRKRWLRPKNP